MHTMHYLYANRHAGIGYTSDGNREPIAWYDSGHMQDRVDYKSQYGYVIMWFGGPLCWISKKHNHVGESSAEDEYITRDAKEYPETISSEIQGGRPLHFLRVLSWVPLLEYPPMKLRTTTSSIDT